MACTYAFTVLCNPALVATKTAILILYYRIAAAYPFLRYASLFSVVVINIAGVVLTFLYIFQCDPVAAAFSSVGGTCIDIVGLYLSSMPINVFTDLAILLLPLPILTTLRMESRQKAILVATFIVGGFVTIVDVVRVVYLQEALKAELQIDPSASITATSRPPNFTYYASYSLMWSAVEVSVGIMCCCVLVLKPLVMRIMPKLLHAPHIPHHRTNTTAESPLPSDQSRDRRSFDGVHVGEALGSFPPPLSAIQPATMPVSLRTAELSQTESPVSPLSPRPRTISVIPEQLTNDDDGDGMMYFFQMLACEPPPESPPGRLSPLEEAPTRRHSAPRRSIMSERRDTVQSTTSQSFFDFVQVKGKVPLMQLSAKEAWWPTMFVSILFFLWGFAYGLLGSLTDKIQTLLGYPPSHTIALHNAYWTAYFFGPLLVGYWVLKREGFKATFMAGLAIYATGALSFWPSSILRPYPGFIVSNFIIALGLSNLEVAANPFIALAGPDELSESRLNFAQGIQGIGSIVSPIIAQVWLFGGIDRMDLFRVQWCYFAVALFVIFLAIVFYYVPLSEAADDDLEAMALQRLFNAGLDQGDKAFGVDARRLLLWSGVIIMWLYCGNQESVAYYWNPLVQDVQPGSNPFWDLTIGRSVFSFSRFLASGLCFVGIPPRITIAVCIVGGFVSSLLALVLPRGNAALAMLILYYFFEGPIFPTLFAMILRGQGKHTKFTATALTMAIVGASMWPGVDYAIQQGYPTNSRWSLLLVVILYGTSIPWPVMVSSKRVLRRWVDPKWGKRRITLPDEHGRAPGRPVPRHEKAMTAHLDTEPEGSTAGTGSPDAQCQRARKPSVPTVT